MIKCWKGQCVIQEAMYCWKGVNSPLVSTEVQRAQTHPASQQSTPGIDPRAGFLCLSTGIWSQTIVWCVGGWESVGKLSWAFIAGSWAARQVSTHQRQLHITSQVRQPKASPFLPFPQLSLLTLQNSCTVHRTGQWCPLQHDLFTAAKTRNSPNSSQQKGCSRPPQKKGTRNFSHTQHWVNLKQKTVSQSFLKILVVTITLIPHAFFPYNSNPQIVPCKNI